MGGTVEAKYQYAYNGIKVRVPSRKVAALATQPGVKAIHPVRTYTVDNRRSVPFIGAPAVWQDFGDTGNGQTIAVIDTGIDYTHANFGGAGHRGRVRRQRLHGHRARHLPDREGDRRLGLRR